MQKMIREDIQPDSNSSFKILLTPNLNDLFYWHFHQEYEIVYVEGVSGIRHIGDHISRYAGSDLALIGPFIPHLNFDYGSKTRVETVVVQMKENFLGPDFFGLPEIKGINALFERARTGLAFYGKTRALAGEKLKKLKSLSNFNQLLTLLEVFHLLAESEETIDLNARANASNAVLKEQQRIQKIYHYIETNYQQPLNVNDIANLVHLTTAAFCRYFKKSTHLTFTDFLNQYRINQAKKLLIHNSNVTEACFSTGFNNLSHFNKTFKKLAGENPLAFKRKYVKQ